MVPLGERYRSQAFVSTYGGVEPRWLLIHSEPRQSQAQRTVAKQLGKQGDADVRAFKQLCGTTFACEAEASPALVHFQQGVQATVLQECTLCPTPRYRKRGRPSP